MTYSVLYEKVNDPAFPPDYYYAIIPTLDLTTHGLGLDGARAAAIDLVRLWIEEKQANGEEVPVEHDAFFSHIVLEDALFSA
jgi:predicted RNase H-like HicB family nuclease